MNRKRRMLIAGALSKIPIDRKKRIEERKLRTKKER
jgi:hypothetical protein